MYSFRFRNHVLLVQPTGSLSETRQYLLDNGFGILKASTAEAASQVLAAMVPDMVVVHHMPQQVDARLLCTEIRQYEHLENTPILVWITNAQADEPEVDWHALGVSRVVRLAQPEGLLANMRDYFSGV